ncbi:MAG TPA: FAD-dependent monooxygenase [Solirubrobacteraceae bacterium]|nr:FAD-dependent monooxygenase [Solirubrobacteraceae bacterium]
MSEPRVAIVGGGIGGLVLALALRDRGVSFDVYEQAAELREIGAAVFLSANGTRELRRLGIGEQVEAVSVVPSALVIRRFDTGEVIADHPIGRSSVYEATFGAPCYGLHRVALLQALAERLGGEGLNLARRCVGVVEHRSGVELAFADGTTAEADVVVGADGVHSVVRSHIVGEARGRYSGTVGYRGLVPVENTPSLPDATPLQFWAGPGRHLLHYAIDGGRTINFLAVVRVAEWTNVAWMEECAISDAVDAFAGWHPAVTEMVGATQAGTRWALHDLAPLARWHTERVVLIGDAAHAMVPHQGQGANQTIEDVIVLADYLADADLPGDLASVLRRYQERRRRRTIAVQWLSRRTADLMHLPDGPQIAHRDALLADLYSSLAWIHSHDAHADYIAQRPAVTVASRRT